MTKHPVATDADLGLLVESVTAVVDRVSASNEPSVSLRAVQHPTAVVRVVTTPIGLLRLVAHLLQHLKDARTRDQQEEFERICADDSSALVIDLVDTMPPSSTKPSKPRAGLWAAAMMGLWVSSLLLWAIGLYASITWVGVRLTSWW